MFQKFFWTTLRKNCSSEQEKSFEISRLKAESLQIFWDHINNLFEQWKVRTIFETEYFLNLLLEAWFNRTIKIPIWTNNWDVETQRVYFIIVLWADFF